jgi:UDP-glucose 4-epimerase
VEKGVALISSLVRAGVRQFVFSSTCAVYGEHEHMPIREEARLWSVTRSKHA